MRLVGRLPRLGRVLVLLAAIGGLFAVLWTGPASAAEVPKRIALKTTSAPGQVYLLPIRICGEIQMFGGTVCTPWATYSSSGYDTHPANPFAGYAWLWGRVTLCLGGQAMHLQFASDTDNPWVEVDVSDIPVRQEAPSLECL